MLSERLHRAAAISPRPAIGSNPRRGRRYHRRGETSAPPRQHLSANRSMQLHLISVGDSVMILDVGALGLRGSAGRALLTPGNDTTDDEGDLALDRGLL
jgi:hypothetical protein